MVISFTSVLHHNVITTLVIKIASLRIHYSGCFIYTNVNLLCILFLHDSAIWCINSFILSFACSRFRIRRLCLRCPILCAAFNPGAWTWDVHRATCNSFCVSKNFCSGRELALHGSIRWQFSQLTWILVHNVSTLKIFLIFFLLLGICM